MAHHFNMYAGVAELADAPDLGSGGRPWGFKSLHPHHTYVPNGLHAFRASRLFKYVPLAQLDRAFDYESKGREFESLRARHIIDKTG